VAERFSSSPADLITQPQDLPLLAVRLHLSGEAVTKTLCQVLCCPSCPCSYAAPLHRIKTDDMLPLKLLTPFQGENDHHIKDTYNYATVQVRGGQPSVLTAVVRAAAGFSCWVRTVVG
jgi:hypothetical protein